MSLENNISSYSVGFSVVCVASAASSSIGGHTLVYFASEHAS